MAITLAGCTRVLGIDDVAPWKRDASVDHDGSPTDARTSPHDSAVDVPSDVEREAKSDAGNIDDGAGTTDRVADGSSTNEGGDGTDGRANVDAATADAERDVSDPIEDDDASSIAPPRLLAPLSTSTVTSQRPRLRFELAPGIDGATVDICRDRDCASPVVRLDVIISSAVPTTDLHAGVYFWRVYGRRRGVRGVVPSPTWQFTVGARSAPVDRSWGTTLDVNGDGYADLIVHDWTIGKFYLFRGSPLGLGAQPAYTFDGPKLKDHVAPSIASAGDLNGDGFADVVVGSLDDGAYVYLGGRLGLAPGFETLTNPVPAIGGYAGFAASAGDVNGDGYADLLIGAGDIWDPPAHQASGRAYLYFGGVSGISKTPAVTLGPVGPYTSFGTAAASAGDVDNNGCADLVIGAYQFDFFRGRAYLFLGGPSGGAGAAAATFLQPSPLAAYFGISVDNVGDVNGDGYADVSVGGTLDNHGRAFLYLGQSGGFPTQATIELDALGPAVGGDLNGDGLSDVLASAPHELGVYFGRTEGLSTTPDVVLPHPDGPDASFGAVTAAGDINGDGFQDFLDAWLNGVPGKAYVYLGRGSTLGPLLAGMLSTDGAPSFVASKDAGANP